MIIMMSNNDYANVVNYANRILQKLPDCVALKVTA